MADYTAGRVVVPVIPSTKGIQGPISKAFAGQSFKVSVKPEIDKNALTEFGKAKLDADAGQLEAKIKLAKAKLEELNRQKVDPQIDLDIAAAEKKMDTLKDKLSNLEAKRQLGLNVDDSIDKANAQITALQNRIQRLSAMKSGPKIDADIAKAEADIRTLEVKLAGLDGRDVTIDVKADDHGSLGRLNTNLLGVLATAAKLAAIGPLIGAAVGGAGALGGALAVLGVGAAATAGGLSGVGDAYKAMSDQQAKAGTDARKSAAQQVSSANSIANAQDSLAKAQASVGQARQQAARAIASAVSRQEDAEKNLAEAQRDAVKAQQAITDARKAAQQAAEDLTNDVKDGALQQRRAVMDVADAKSALDAVMADPTASKKARDEAQLTYDEAAQSLDEITLKNKRLAEEKAASDKAGIDGSTQVTAATENYAAAQDKVVSAQKDVREAGDAVVQARQDGDRQILDSQQAVIQAQRALQDAYAQAQAAGEASADTVAQKMGELSKPAQDFVTFLFGTVKPALEQLQTTAAGGLLPGLTTGIQALLTQMPIINTVVGQAASAFGSFFAILGQGLAGGQFAQFWTMIGNAAGPLMSQLAGQLLIVAGAAVQLITALMPAAPAAIQVVGVLGTLVSTLAPYLGQMAQILAPALVQVLTALTPAFDALGRILVALAPLLAQVAVDLATGLSSALQAAAPWIERVSTALQAQPGLLTGIIVAVGGAAAAWSTFAPIVNGGLSLFEKLGPLLGEKGIGGALGQLGSKFSFLTGPVGIILGLLVALYAGNEQFRNSINGLVQLLISSVVPVFTLLFQTLAPIVTQLVQMLVPVITQLAMALIPILQQVILALAPVLMQLAQIFVQVVVALMPIVLTIMNTLLPLITDTLIPVILQLMPIFTQVFGMIAQLVVWALQTIVVPLLTNVVIPAIQFLASIIQWLALNIVAPMFRGIATAISWAWDNVIKPVLGFFIDMITNTGSAVDKAVQWIKDSWQKIQDATKTPVQWVIDVVWNHGIVPLWNGIADTFGLDSWKLSEYHLAGGGILPGYSPGKDTIRAVLSPGEAVLVPELVRAIGPQAILDANSAFSGGRPPGAVPAGLGPLSAAGGASLAPGPAPNSTKGDGAFGGFDLGGMPGGHGAFQTALLNLPASIGKMIVQALEDSLGWIWDIVKGALGFAGGGVVPGGASGRSTTRRFAGGGVTSGTTVNVAVSAAGGAVTGAAGTAVDPGTQADAASTTDDLTTSVDNLAAAVTAANTTALGPFDAALAQLTVTTVPALVAAVDGVTGTTLPALVTELVSQVFPNLAQLAVALGTTDVLAVQALGSALVPLQNAFTWTSTVVAVAMANSTASIGNMVSSANGYFANMSSGLSNLNSAIGNTASWAQSQFNAIREFAAGPIRWVLQQPFNAGLIAAWNSLDAQFQLNRHVPDVPIPFATGGRVPGVGDGDTVPAMLTPGEYVFSKRAIRAMGGLGAVDALHNAAKSSRAAWRQFGGDPGGPGLAYFAEGGAVGKALAWAKTQDDKPYQWAGTGNPSWDCSGFQSGIVGVLTGGNPNQRRFTTASFSPSGAAPAGFVPGIHSAYAVGVVNGNPGHMAGTLGGVNVESGGNGVQVGPPALGALDPSFTMVFSLPEVGGVFTGGGGSFDPAAIVQGFFDPAYQLIGRTTPEMFPANNLPGEFGKAIATQAADALKGKAVEALNSMFTVSGGAAGSPEVVNAVRAVAEQYGWDQGAEWDALYQLVSHESGWDPNAANPSSSARGLFQKLTGTNGPLENTVAGQAQWGLGYIKQRYGTPSNAWAQWLSRSPHWYDTGGWLDTGETLVRNDTGRPEAVLTNRQWGVAERALTGSGPSQLSGDLYLDSGEFLGVVRGVVVDTNDRNATALVRGRR